MVALSEVMFSLLKSGINKIYILTHEEKYFSLAGMEDLVSRACLAGGFVKHVPTDLLEREPVRPALQGILDGHMANEIQDLFVLSYRHTHVQAMLVS